MTSDDPRASPDDLSDTEVIGSDFIEPVDSDASSESEVTMTIQDVREVADRSSSVLNDIEPIIGGKYLDSSCQSALDDVNHLTKLASLAEGSSSSSSSFSGRSSSEEKNVNYSRGTNDRGRDSSGREDDTTRSSYRGNRLAGIQSKRDPIHEEERCSENEAPTTRRRMESPTSSNLEDENSIQMRRRSVAAAPTTELSSSSPRLTDGIHDPSSLGSRSGELASPVSFGRCFN